MKVLSDHELLDILHALCDQPRESEWVEFKENNAKPDDIGEYISALANAAHLLGQGRAWLVWGVTDSTHQIVGTAFKPTMEKVGNEELENWLHRFLTPRVEFRFHSVQCEGKNVVMLEIVAEAAAPVAFKKVRYIRVGTYKKRLDDFPEKERLLWPRNSRTSFERDIAKQAVSNEEVCDLLDFRSYFKLLGLPVPESIDVILHALAQDGMILQSDGAGWDITNQGAVLFANDLNRFDRLERKAVRVVHYSGEDRTQSEGEREGRRGYASGFEGLVKYVLDSIPANEVIEQALRRRVPMFPDLAVRELIANALIHQDLSIAGTGPMIEIFATRIEITNPGLPLVRPDRFLDSPPQSRNESLAKFMRRAGICEERGSGVDKVVFQTELYQLPAPLFETLERHTRAVLFAHRDLKKMDKADRTRACYLHACLRYVQRDYMTNTTLRERFGIEEKDISVASRLIKEALEEGVIVPFDADAGRKYMKYVPFWAA